MRAVVCLTPFVPGRETQRSAGTPVLRLAAAASADRVRMLFGRDPRGVAVAGEPGETAILVREDAAAGERSMLPAQARIEASGDRAELDDGVVWENRVVLRPRLRTPHPLRIAADVRCPVLVVAGVGRRPLPAGPAAELARRLPEAELETFEGGHFDLYAGRSIAAEADFLSRRPHWNRLIRRITSAAIPNIATSTAKAIASRSPALKRGSQSDPRAGLPAKPALASPTVGSWIGSDCARPVATGSIGRSRSDARPFEQARRVGVADDQDELGREPAQRFGGGGHGIADADLSESRDPVAFEHLLGSLEAVPGLADRGIDIVERPIERPTSSTGATRITPAGSRGSRRSSSSSSSPSGSASVTRTMTREGDGSLSVPVSECRFRAHGGRPTQDRACLDALPDPSHLAEYGGRPTVDALLVGDHVGDGIDQRQVGERLREVAEVAPAPGVELLGEEVEPARRLQQSFAERPRPRRLADLRQGRDQPEGADQEGPLLAREAVVGLVDQ